jgi:hypothetical protein
MLARLPVGAPDASPSRVRSVMSAHRSRRDARGATRGQGGRASRERSVRHADVPVARRLRRGDRSRHPTAHGCSGPGSRRLSGLGTRVRAGARPGGARGPAAGGATGARAWPHRRAGARAAADESGAHRACPHRPPHRVAAGAGAAPDLGPPSSSTSRSGETVQQHRDGVSPPAGHPAPPAGRARTFLQRAFPAREQAEAPPRPAVRRPPASTPSAAHSAPPDTQTRAAVETGPDHAAPAAHPAPAARALQRTGASRKPVGALRPHTETPNAVNSTPAGFSGSESPLVSSSQRVWLNSDTAARSVALVTRSGRDPAPVQRAAARVGPVQPTAALPVPQTAVPRTAVPPQRALPTLRPTAPRDDPQPVQRRVDVVPSAPVPASAPEPAPAPEPQKQGPPGQRELDELVRRLYGPLSRRIKAELRIDRERAGQFNPG